jgi:hypothetical protein
MLCIFASRYRRRGIVYQVYAGGRREKYSKRGAGPELRLYRNTSTEALNDAMNHRKAQTGALTHRTGGKERFEYALDGLRVHAVARVADPKLDARLRDRAVVGMRVVSETNGQ